MEGVVVEGEMVEKGAFLWMKAMNQTMELLQILQIL